MDGGVGTLDGGEGGAVAGGAVGVGGGCYGDTDGGVCGAGCEVEEGRRGVAAREEGRCGCVGAGWVGCCVNDTHFCL